MKEKSFLSIFSEVFNRLPKKRQKQFWLLFVYMIFVSVVATVTVGSIALFAAVFSSPEKILSSKYVITAQNVLQIDFLKSPKGIMLFLSLLMVFLVGVKNLLQSLLLYCVAHFGAAIEAYFGVVLFKGFLNMPYQWHLNRNSADIILALQWRSFIGHSFINTSLTALSDILLVSFLTFAILLVNPYIDDI